MASGWGQDIKFAADQAKKKANKIDYLDLAKQQFFLEGIKGVADLVVTPAVAGTKEIAKDITHLFNIIIVYSFLPRCCNLFGVLILDCLFLLMHSFISFHLKTLTCSARFQVQACITEHSSSPNPRYSRSLPLGS